MQFQFENNATWKMLKFLLKFPPKYVVKYCNATYVDNVNVMCKMVKQIQNAGIERVQVLNSRNQHELKCWIA
jgi:hypothetical protein